ncbi:MAG: hypothetical protein ACLTSL_07935 [Odoribacter splanchnicus]
MKYYLILLAFFIFSCQSRETPQSSYPVIHLNPDKAGILKMSDYFDNYQIVHFKNAICNTIQDIAKYPDKYYYYTPSEFLKMIESVRSKKSDSEWKAYCQKKPSLIQTYLEINDNSNAVIISYHFK